MSASDARSFTHPSGHSPATSPSARTRDDVARDRLFALSVDLLSVANFDGFFEQVNPAWTRCLGWTPEELTSRPSIEFVHPDDRASTLTVRGDIVTGRTAREFENRYLCKDGSTRLLSWSVHPSVESRQVFGVARDITERRRVEQQLQRAQRLESLATLAGGFAHDLNNVFAPILMAIDLLPLDLDPVERAEILANVESSARRGARLVGQVLSFARGVDGDRVDVDLRHLVPPLVAAVCDREGPAIDVQFDLPADLHQVVGDPQQIQEVVQALCVNACEAMPRGGMLRLSAANVSGSSDVLDRTQARGPLVELVVADSGTGMTPDVLARIFDPFFTTRTAGTHAGLGLSKALAIVQGHGGRIDVESVPDRGSTFRVLWPARVEAPAAATSGLPQALAHGRGQLVLVVDDEASVRLLTRRALEAGGYRTMLAADGAEALEMFRAHADEVALVLTDMRMPVMDGTQTLAALRQVRPLVHLIVATGIGDDPRAAEVDGPVRRLAKPYSTEALLAAVHEVLGAPAPR